MKWYDKLLPFVAKSPEAKLRWLVQVFASGSLTPADLTPYLRLLLMEEGEGREELQARLRHLDGDDILRMLEAAEIYDTPKLFRLIEHPTVQHALAALAKVPPPYEKTPCEVVNQIFAVIYERSPALLETAAEALARSGKTPPHFAGAYERFKEILADQRILLALYPQATVPGRGD